MTSQPESYCLIQLTKGQFARVIYHRHESLNRYRWKAMWNPPTKSYYAFRRERVNGNTIQIYMHREILGLGYGDLRTGDHHNLDTLDNTDDNLRVATHSQQAQHRHRRCDNTTGFKGVKLNRHNGFYIAQVTVAGRKIYLGQRSTPEAAYRELYVPAALKHYGEFACLE